MICIICLKPIKKRINLKCNHNFHFTCLKEKNNNLKCVLCNSPMIKDSKEKKIIRNITSKIDTISTTQQGDKYKFNIVLELFKYINENIVWVKSYIAFRSIVLIKAKELIVEPRLKIMNQIFIKNYKYELGKTINNLNK